MSTKRRVTQAAIRLLKQSFGVLGSHRASVLAAQVAEQMPPVCHVGTPLGALRFFCPSPLPLWRAETLLTKEPETIAWIDTFRPGDVLWDIGANVGVYSLYAGLQPGVQVLAFEPAVVNAYVLNRNIEANGFDDRISWFGIAFTDVTGLDQFHMSTTESGGALHGFGEARDHQGKLFHATFRQAAIGFSIDDFVARFHPPFPTHIKIDVDGIEDRIVNGAARTLADSRLRSVLVELEIDRPEYCQAVIDRLADAGLRLASRQHGPMFETGRFASTYNHIFVRA